MDIERRPSPHVHLYRLTEATNFKMQDQKMTDERAVPESATLVYQSAYYLHLAWVSEWVSRV